MTALNWTYALAPLLAWLVAGSLKFALNSLRAGKPAFGAIGLGSFPSNHSTIVSTMASLVGWREGFDSAAFGIALTLTVIVVIDALDLRRRIGQQAAAINRITPSGLRERTGHTPFEVAGGLLLGSLLGYVLATAAG